MIGSKIKKDKILQNITRYFTAEISDKENENFHQLKKYRIKYDTWIVEIHVPFHEVYFIGDQDLYGAGLSHWYVA